MNNVSTNVEIQCLGFSDSTKKKKVINSETPHSTRRRPKGELDFGRFCSSRASTSVQTPVSGILLEVSAAPHAHAPSRGVRRRAPPTSDPLTCSSRGRAGAVAPAEGAAAGHGRGAARCPAPSEASRTAVRRGSRPGCELRVALGQRRAHLAAEPPRTMRLRQSEALSFRDR